LLRRAAALYDDEEDDGDGDDDGEDEVARGVPRFATHRMIGSQQRSEVPATLVGTSGDRIRFTGDRFVLDVFVLFSPSLPRNSFLSLDHFIGAPRVMRAYDRGSWRVSCASADVCGGGNGDSFDERESS